LRAKRKLIKSLLQISKACYLLFAAACCTRHIVNRWTATGERAAEHVYEMREPESNEQQTCPENDPLLEFETIADNIPLENFLQTVPSQPRSIQKPCLKH
jgi:hypothetical protein